jgi:hypothetical protein
MTLSVDFQSKMIELLNQEFTEEESQFYIASFIMYLNYHPTNDFQSLKKLALQTKEMR